MPKNACDIICVLEIPRDKDNNRLKMREMLLVLERSHKKYGSLIFVSDNLKILSTSHIETNYVEIFTVEFTICMVTSM